MVCVAKRPPEWVNSNVRIRRGRNAPDWALKIVRKECKLRVMTLFWNEQGGRRKGYVSGLASNSKLISDFGCRAWFCDPNITINAGENTTERYQLSVLLHEIAHHNVGLSHDHDKTWCAEACRLYRKYGLLEEVIENRYYGYTVEKKAVQTTLNRVMAAKRARS